MDVLYVDNHLLVVNKPAGLLTQPSPLEQESLENQAKEWIKAEFKKPGHVFLHCIHRLDKPVSGIVLFARTSKGLSRLNQFMREGKFIKTYYARLEKPPEEKKGFLEDRLEREEFHSRVVEEGGRLAQLEYEVTTGSLVKINLITGRYHQIRVQMANMGCPIVGDRKYGATTGLPIGIALHHGQLVFPHPIGREELLFEAPLPDYFVDEATS